LGDLKQGLENLNHSLDDLNHGLDIKDQVLPLECQYMNTNAILSIGARKQPTSTKKHFELRRIPKSASLRSELLVKSEDLTTTKLKPTVKPSSYFPVRKIFSSSEPTIVSPSKGFVSGLRFNLQGASSRHSNLKLLEIVEQPLPLSKERRKLQKKSSKQSRIKVESNSKQSRIKVKSDSKQSSSDVSPSQIYSENIEDLKPIGSSKSTKRKKYGPRKEIKTKTETKKATKPIRKKRILKRSKDNSDSKAKPSSVVPSYAPQAPTLIQMNPFQPSDFHSSQIDFGNDPKSKKKYQELTTLSASTVKSLLEYSTSNLNLNSSAKNALNVQSIVSKENTKRKVNNKLSQAEQKSSFHLTKFFPLTFDSDSEV
jgi:hypothetical protein